MFDCLWEINKSSLPSDNFSSKEEYWLHAIMEKMGVKDKEKFLNPSFDDLYDPFLLPQIDIAIDRILEAVDNGEHIAIFGDYDCDGVTATTILYDFLTKQLEADCEYVLPDRFAGGYGISLSSIEEIARNGSTLIITVDNGVSAVNEIERAKELGIDVVVTDHHEIPEVLPDCVAIVNPHLPESQYPLDCLCGAGVAFKLVQALSVSVGLDDDYFKYLPLVAIGTIGDVMPLVDENRVMVKLGLELMKDTEFAGIRGFLRDEKFKDGIDGEKVSFNIVPKLNVAGRMATADLAAELLLSGSDYEADQLLANILTLIDKRNTELETVMKSYKEGKSVIYSEDLPLIVVKGDNFHHGVVGLAASKIMEDSNKAAIVLGFDKRENGENIYRASSRGIESFNLFDMLKTCNDLFEKFGGHDKAAGFSIKESNIDDFIKRCIEFLHDTKINQVVRNSATIEIPIEDISIKLATEIQKLGPFGEGNPKPIIFTKGVTFTSTRVLKDIHLKCNFTFENGKSVEAISFGKGKYESMFTPNIKGGILYTIGLNSFNGRTSVQLGLLDFCENYDECDFLLTYKLSRDGAALLYKQLLNLGETFTFSDVYKLKLSICKAENVPNSIKNEFTWFKIQFTLMIFVELGYINVIKKGSYEFVKNQKAKQLIDSNIFRELS